jgi:multidrug efflux pump subunit AcrB
MVKFALRSPYTIIVLALMAVIVGTYAMLRMPMDILPAIRIPAVMVVTTYTGMPAETIEMDITNRLERWLSQASGLDHIESRSMIGVSILNCFFEPGFDPNNALAQISTLVMSDLHYLPPGTMPPIVMGYDPTAALPIALMSIFTPGLTEAKLWDESNYIVRNQLNAVSGAVAPVVFGGKLRQVLTYLNEGELVGHGLSPLDVVEALRVGNAMIPMGDAKIGSVDYSISSNGMVPSVGEFDRLPVKIAKGAPIFIKDIGHTADASAVQTNSVQIDGIKETYIPIFRRLGASTLSVVAGVKREISNILISLPDETRLRLLFDQSTKISDAIYDVIRELVMGVLLAALVIYLFLGSLTPTMIAAITIPLSILGGMLALYYCDQSLNLMTLGGLALITGPLIDKSVVALENVERHLELGATPAEAAEKGTEEVTMPVLMASLALIIVFFPVTFFQGLGKFIFTPMALTVAVTEIISYFAVMMLVPLMASRFFKSKASAHHHSTFKPLQLFNEGFFAFRARYNALLDWSLEKPKVVIALTTGVLVLSLGLVPFIGSEFFPVADHGQFFIRLRAPTGSRLEVTDEIVRKVSDSIQSLLPKDAVEVIMANSGVLPSWAAAYSPNSASHDSLLEVELKEDAGVGAYGAVNVLRPALAHAYPDVHFAYSLIDPVASALNYGALSPVDVRVLGPKLEDGEKIANELLDRMRLVPGITDSFVEQKLDYPAIHIDVDRIKAGYLGLTADGVIKNVITALNSSVLFSQNFWDDPVSGNNYYIGAMYPEATINSKETIANIPITPPSAGASSSSKEPPTLLRNIATLSDEKVPVEISHYNIKRSIDVMANVENRDIGSVASDIDRIIAGLKLPKGYYIRWGGAIEAMRASFGSMGVGLVLSLVLIFLLMVAQLKSFLDPLLIMATVPMGFIGVFWILFLTNTTFNIQSMMGMIMLIGIVVSNTVILTDFANNRLEQGGISPKLAIREAGITRLRPILMTAISAIMALLPSSISGANAPLARAVIGGLLTSTCLTLVFLPALYSIAKKGSKKV